MQSVLCTVQVVSSHMRWDGSDTAALSAQFRKELEKERSSCEITGGFFV